MAELRAREEDAHRKLAKEGRRFLGVARVRCQSPFARPSSGEPRFGLKPRIASADKWKRIEGLRRLVDWASAYAAARLRWCAGDRDVVFPAGTWLMRVLHAAQCAPAPWRQALNPTRARSGVSRPGPRCACGVRVFASDVRATVGKSSPRPV